MTKHNGNGNGKSESRNGTSGLEAQVARLVAVLERQGGVTSVTAEETELQRQKRLNRERQQRFRDQRKKNGNGDLVRSSQVGYSESRRGQEMQATKTKHARNGRNGHKNGEARSLTRVAMPTGLGLVGRIARGLRMWRERQGLTIPKMAEKYKLPLQSLYRTERGQSPATLILNIDKICEATGLDIIEVLQLGA